MLYNYLHKGTVSESTPSLVFALPDRRFRCIVLRFHLSNRLFNLHILFCLFLSPPIHFAYFLKGFLNLYSNAQLCRYSVPYTTLRIGMPRMWCLLACSLVRRFAGSLMLLMGLPRLSLCHQGMSSVALSQINRHTICYAWHFLSPISTLRLRRHKRLPETQSIWRVWYKAPKGK